MTNYNNKSNMRKEYLCELCNFKTNLKENFRIHTTTKKHKKIIYESGKYTCELCYYSTSLYQNFQKHLETQKHKSKMDKEEHKIEFDSKKETIKMLVDEIKGKDEEIKGKDEEIKELIFKLYEDQKDINEELKRMNNYTNSIQGSHNIINNLTNNNNTFNLQVFLNETCKNAMNIEDFVESIVIDVKDLKYLGNKGYVEGISSIIIEKLNEIAIEMRPMHCTDIKRENIYVRTYNNWEKEDTKKTKTNGLIREVQRANTRALQDVYQKTYPQCMSNYNSKEHKEYGEIIHQNFWGGKVNYEELNKKIIRKVVQEIPIEKNIN
uniref:C2H2-type domain-containing protein n=1 Tax=viral metagenome TaxID=1070528 RepID=A0A6C0IN97_9ZZZZ